MLPLATIHSMFLAPVNQKDAENLPNQRSPFSKTLLILQIFLLALNHLITDSL